MPESPSPEDQPLASVSVIVPTKDSARTLARCLESIQAAAKVARAAGVETESIVVDNPGSQDATSEIAAQLADRLAIKGPERSAQRNHGAELATGDVVVFIDSDMVLESDMTLDVARLFGRDPAVGAAVLPEYAFGEGFLASCRVLEKQLYLGDDAVEAARAFRTTAFVEVGGYERALVGPEDWELPERVRDRGWAVARTPAGVWHDEGRIDLGAQFKKKRYYGRSIGQYRRMRPADARGHFRRSSLIRQPGLLARHPLEAVGLAVLKSVEATGILMGMWDTRKS